MRNKFDMQLELLHERLIHMGELCEVAINRATEALKEKEDGMLFCVGSLYLVGELKAILAERKKKEC